MIRIVAVSIVVFVLNIPFGYWRANVHKFSWQWVLAIHLPVPIIIFLRIYSHIGFAWYTYIFLVGTFFLGHRMGAFLHNKYLEKHNQVSSCLVWDIKKALRL